VKKGDFVKIEYEARIVTTGQLFDTTKMELAAKQGIRGAEGPETIVVGERYVIKGLDEELEKRKVGEEFTINIPAEKAFGKRRQELIRTFSLQMFRNEKINPLPGLVVNLGGLNGKILSVSGGRVRVDFNHPLASRAVQYKSKILEKVSDEKEKVKAILKSRLQLKPEVKKTEKKLVVTTEKTLEKPVIQMIIPEIKKHVKMAVEFKTKTTKKH
jgi:FKBP-type peptidyl-prolyl cis-trans isomerase 2